MTRPAERPWQDVIVEKHAERERTHGRLTLGRLPRFQFNAHPVFVRALDAAAARYHYDRSTYIRRVLAVHIAKDTGFPLGMLLSACPKPKVPRLTGHTLENTPGVDTGEGMHRHCPHPGCSGRHLLETLPEQ